MNTERIKELADTVFQVVAEQTGIEREKLCIDTMLDESQDVDTATYYRIVSALDQELGVGALEGDWSFASASIQALVEYYAAILDNKLDR